MELYFVLPLESSFSLMKAFYVSSSADRKLAVLSDSTFKVVVKSLFSIM